MKKLRGAIVGAGYFSSFQREAWERIPEVDVVGFADRDPAKAGKFPGLEFFPDYRDMLDRLRPDFIDIITPPPAHAEICAEAGRRGIHVVCQKPLAPSFAESVAIVERTERDGIRLMIHENFRFQPWHREFKRQLDAGAIGSRIFSISCRTRLGDGWGPQAYIPRQSYFRDYERLLIYETGVHFIDTFRYLVGEISRVSAWTRRLNPSIRGEDCGLLVFEFANGVLGQWDANRYNEPNYADPRHTFGEFLLEGESGALRLYPDGRMTRQRLGQAEFEIPYFHERRGFAGDCCYFTQRHFIDRMIDGGAFETGGRDYLRTLAVQEAAYVAAQRGGPVEIST